MPLLFCLGQHRALVSVQTQLQERERLFAGVFDPGRTSENQDRDQHPFVKNKALEQSWHQA